MLSARVQTDERIVRASCERSCPPTKGVSIAARKFGECDAVDSERSVDLQINCGFGVSAALGKQISLILQFAVRVRSTGRYRLHCLKASM